MRFLYAQSEAFSRPVLGPSALTPVLVQGEAEVKTAVPQLRVLPSWQDRDHEQGSGPGTGRVTTPR